MSRRYTPDEKSAILAQLRANHGNITLTHLQTGLPERTLRQWRREQWLEQLPPPPPPTPHRRQQETPVHSPDVKAHGGAPNIPTFDNDLEAVKFLRGQILKELLNLSASLNDGLFITTPYQRALVLTQLLDRLMKLDEHLKPYVPFDYGDEDLQMAYHKPSYERDDDDLDADPFSHPSTEDSQDVEES